MSPRALVISKTAFAFAFRLGCYALMLWMLIYGEARPAPSLPDAVLAVVPYVEVIDRYNYLVWLVAYVPVAFALLFRDPHRFFRYMLASGVLAVVRGLCVLATGLGPVHGPDINAGLDADGRSKMFWQLANPFGFFSGGAHVYLTKDLFFSGHAGTTFLLLLNVWRYPRLRWWMLAAHILVVATIFLSHLHYTIDVIGAYAITFCLYFIEVRIPPARWLGEG